MIKIVGTLTKIEIHDADAIDLFHGTILLAERNMFGNSFCYSIQYSLQIVKLTSQLHFDYDDLTIAVLGFDVNTVELIICVILIPFTLQYFINFDRLAQKDGYQTFQHTEIGFVTKHPFHCPVKSYIFIRNIHRSIYLDFTCKDNQFL